MGGLRWVVLGGCISCPCFLDVPPACGVFLLLGGLWMVSLACASDLCIMRVFGGCLDLDVIFGIW